MKEEVVGLVRCARMELDRQVASIKKRLRLVERLATLDDVGTWRLLFELWDSDKDGKLGFSDIAIGLSKLNPDRSFDSCTAEAINQITMFDTDHDNALNKREAQRFMEFVMQGFEGSYRDCVRILALIISSPSNPEEAKLQQSILTLLPVVARSAQASTAKDADTLKSREEEANVIMKAWNSSSRGQMKDLFDQFDSNGTGTVSFAKVVRNASPGECGRIGLHARML